MSPNKSTEWYQVKVVNVLDGKTVYSSPDLGRGSTVVKKNTVSVVVSSENSTRSRYYKKSKKVWIHAPKISDLGNLLTDSGFAQFKKDYP